MKLSAEQMRVLGEMKLETQYAPKELGCKWTTLDKLYECGYVAEELLWRWWALFTGQHHRRRFKITAEGYRQNAPVLRGDAFPSRTIERRAITNEDADKVVAAIERQEVQA